MLTERIRSEGQSFYAPISDWGRLHCIFPAVKDELYQQYLDANNDHDKKKLLRINWAFEENV
jgi:hypothetical protein